MATPGGDGVAVLIRAREEVSLIASQVMLSALQRYGPMSNCRGY